MEDLMETNARVSGSELKMEFEDGVSFRLDACGRWSMYRQNGEHYLRGLNGLVYPADTDHLEPHQHAADIHQRLLNRLAVVSDQISRGQLNLTLHGKEKSQSRLLELLAAGLEWNLVRYEDEIPRFNETYPDTNFRPPPDRLRDMVVLTALDCPPTWSPLYNGGDTGHRPLTAKTFKAHLAGVIDFLGPAAQNPDGVFLGSWNGLGLSNQQLDFAIETLTNAVTVGKRGIAAYMDPDYAPVRYREDFWHLAEMGLTKIVVCLGSTHTEVRSTINRNTSLDPIKLAVREPKRAGINIGITLLSRAPDPNQTQAHRDDAVRVLSSMELTKKDTVYLYVPPGPANLSAEDQAFAKQLKEEVGTTVIPFLKHGFLYQA